MYDFAQLGAVRQQVEVRQAERGTSAQEAYEQALELIRRFNTTADKRLLKQALELMQKSLDSKSNQVGPYAVLAYLFYGYGQSRQAVKYFRAAEAIDADFPLVRKLRQMMSAGEKILQSDSAGKQAAQPVGSPAMAPPLPEADAGLDYDDLCDQAEDLIIVQLRVLTSEQLPEPQLLQAELESLQARHSHWQEIHASISRRLELAEREIDVTDLRIKLRPFDARLKQIERLISLSQQFIALERASGRLIGRTEAMTLLLGNPEQPEPHQVLEELLDGADRIADKLDDWDAQGISIEPLTPVYKQLVQAIEAFQDALDGGSG